jgi:hypothetical protein
MPPTAFTVYARESLSLGSHAAVHGGVGVHQQGPGNTLVPGFRAAIADHASVDADRLIAADTVLLQTGATVGAVDAASVADQGAQHGPISPPRPVGDLAVRDPLPHGSVEVHVEGGHTRNLVSGSYSDVHIEGHGTLVLAGGQYQIRQLHLEDGATILIDDISTLFAAGSVVIGNNVTIKPSARANPHSLLRIDTTSPDVAGTAIRIGADGQIAATMQTASGTIRVGARTVVRGNILGRQVVLGSNVVVYGLSLCDLAIDKAVNPPWQGLPPPKPQPLGNCSGPLDVCRKWPVECVALQAPNVVVAFWGNWTLETGDPDNLKARIAEFTQAYLASSGFFETVEQYGGVAATKVDVVDVNPSTGTIVPGAPENFIVPCADGKWYNTNSPNFRDVFKNPGVKTLLTSNTLVMIFGDTAVGELRSLTGDACPAGHGISGTHGTHTPDGTDVSYAYGLIPYGTGYSASVTHEVAEAFTDRDGGTGWRVYGQEFWNHGPDGQQPGETEIADKYLCGYGGDRARLLKSGERSGIKYIWSNAGEGGKCSDSSYNGNCCVTSRRTHAKLFASGDDGLFVSELPLGAPVVASYAANNVPLSTCLESGLIGACAGYPVWTRVSLSTPGSAVGVDASGPIAVVAGRFGEANAFVRTAGGAIWRGENANVLDDPAAFSWSLWGKPDCQYQFGGGVAAISTKPGELEAYVVCDTGQPDNLWRRKLDAYTGEFSPWTAIPTDGYILDSAPAVTVENEGVVNIFARVAPSSVGTVGASTMLHMRADLAVEDLAVADPNMNPAHTPHTPTWTYQPLSPPIGAGFLLGQPAAASWANRRVDMVVNTGNPERIWHYSCQVPLLGVDAPTPPAVLPCVNGAWDRPGADDQDASTFTLAPDGALSLVAAGDNRLVLTAVGRDALSRSVVYTWQFLDGVTVSGASPTFGQWASLGAITEIIPPNGSALHGPVGLAGVAW